MIAIAFLACTLPATRPFPGEGAYGTVPVKEGHRAAPMLPLNRAWVLGGDPTFGYAFGGGDLDGDGFDDVAVGLPYLVGPPGRSQAVLGDPAGPTGSPSWTGTGIDGDWLGYTVVQCDLDGDGYTEIVAGAPNEDRVHVYAGSAAGPAGETLLVDPDPPSSSAHLFGIALACGDVDGDGISDLVVGAPLGGANLQGRAWIFRGGAGGLDPAPIWEIRGPSPSSGLGESVAWLGDVNGDGHADLAIGAAGVGASEVYHGGPAGPDTVVDWQIDLAPTSGGSGSGWDSGRSAPSTLGETVAEAGDVNGDGFADLLIGSRFHDMDQGVALLFLGSSAGLEAEAAWIVEGTDYGLFGLHLTGVSDLDGDGYREIAVVAPHEEESGVYRGAIYVFRGSPSGAEAVPAFVVQGAPDTNYAQDVEDLGDVNGDGVPDVGFSFQRPNEIWIYTTATIAVGSDTATPPGDTGPTGIPDTVPSTTTPGTTTDEEEVAEGDKDGGCGCASPGGASATAVPVLLLILTRSRMRWSRPKDRAGRIQRRRRHPSPLPEGL